MADIREIAASRTRGAHYRNREFADMVLAEPTASLLEIALAERLIGGTQPASLSRNFTTPTKPQE